MPDISVIIATCDRVDFLKRAIKSVLGQEKVGVEIIVVNDGKKVNLEELNLSTEQSDKVLIINNKSPYSGVCYSRNQGAIHAKYDLLAFLDDDDYWDSLFLYKMFKLIEENKVDLAAAAFWNVIDEKLVPGKTPPKELNIYEFMEKNPGITGSNFVIHKRIFDNIAGFDETLPTSNDIDFAIRFIKGGGKYTRTTERLVYFSQHGGKRLTQMSRRKIKGSLRFYNKYKREMPNRIKSKLQVRTMLKVDQYRKSKNIKNNSLYSSVFLKAMYISPIYTIRYYLKNIKGNII